MDKLSFEFENCFGIKKLARYEIDFDQCTVALIYASNGVMKSSFSNIFDYISKGQKVVDKVFSNRISCYCIEYCGNRYSNSANDEISDCDKFFVMKSYNDSVKCSGEAASTLVVNSVARKKYDDVMYEIKNIETEFCKELSNLTGISKNKLKEQIIDIFGCQHSSEWLEIYDVLLEYKEKFGDVFENLQVRYIDVFNSSTETLFKNADFMSNIKSYISNVNSLIRKSTVFKGRFSDIRAYNLRPEIERSHLLEAGHKIYIDGKGEITSVEDWDRIFSQEMQAIYGDSSTKEPLQKIQQILAKNEGSRILRDLIQENPAILSYIDNIEDFRRRIIVSALCRMTLNIKNIVESTQSKIRDVKAIRVEAERESEEWHNVVDTFNERFNVPFRVEIKNRADAVLKGVTPIFSFVYEEKEEMSQEMSEDDIKNVLSTGEKHALYLLNIIFEVQKVKKLIEADQMKRLIVADDICDSFDYKNKYAIIEFLLDLSKDDKINLIVLTHNYDFYRTIQSRLNVFRDNCLIAQKVKNGEVSVNKYPYLGDPFKCKILPDMEIADSVDIKLKAFITSIPFCRNIAIYLKKENVEKNLTCCLHIKKNPIDTLGLTMAELASEIRSVFGRFELTDSRKFIDVLFELANEITDEDQVSLENKETLAIASRLKLELFMKKLYVDKEGTELQESNGNQTREWYDKTQGYMNSAQRKIAERVLLITPENIHLNSFMYEPLIDVSSWVLVELYSDTSNMLKKIESEGE